MRTLSGTLTSAITAVSRVPQISVILNDKSDHYPLYQSPAQADAWNDAIVATDGSIVRCQIPRGGTGFAQPAQFQRITAPGTAGQWTSWTNLPGAAANIYQDGGICIVANGFNGLRIFAQQGTGGSALWVWNSSNNGTTWAGPTTVLTPPGATLCAGIGSAGNNDVFFLYQIVGGYGMGASFFSGGAWGAIVAWSLTTLAFAAGVAAHWDAVAAKYTFIWSDTTTLGEGTYTPAGSTWSALPLIAPATTTHVARVSPRLFQDPVTGVYNLTCAESDLGTFTGSVYAYPRIRQSLDLLHWTTGLIAQDITTTYGACIAGSNQYRYLISMPTVFRDINFGVDVTHQQLDVSAAVLSYQHVEQIDKPASIVLVIDNNLGTYSPYVSYYTQTQTQPICLNSTIVLLEGYLTGTPPVTQELVQTAQYHVTQIQFERSPHENQIKIVAKDISYILDTVNRWQNSYTNQTLSFLVKEILTRGGILSISVPGTAQMSQVIANWVLHAGQTYRAALNELCATYSLYYFLDQSEIMQVRELSSSDTASIGYSNAIEMLTWGQDIARSNHVIVTGKPVVGGLLGQLTTGEAFDDLHVHAIGIEHLTHQVDTKLTSSSQCASRAAFLIAEEQRQSSQHQIHVPLNPALQLLDVIAITDQATPTGSGQAGNARIVKQIGKYDAQLAEYDMILDLIGV